MKKSNQQFPIYGIDTFQRDGAAVRPFQVEVFNIHRNFKVSYPHRHDNFFEILYIKTGTGTYTIDFKAYEIKPESLFFVSPNQIHDIKLSPEVTGYIFLFTSEFYHYNKPDSNQLFTLPFFYTISGENQVLYIQNNEAVRQIQMFFDQCIITKQNTEADLYLATRAWLDLLLIYCKKIHTPIVQDQKISQGKVWVKKFLQLVETHGTENKPVRFFAEQLKISTVYLSEVVKEHTGRTCIELIQDRILLEMKSLLKNTNLSIAEIAYQLHFNDPSYFNKYFKKLAQISPGQYRKALPME